jgi:hypothetical protein
MPPTNANPGAGGARVHGISKSDAASPTPNHAPSQTNLAARDFAAALLRLATNLGIGVAHDGKNVLTVAPNVPIELGRWLHTRLCEHSQQVIAIIDAGGRA